MDHHQVEVEEGLLLLQKHQAVDCLANPHLKQHLAHHHQLLYKLPHHQWYNNHKVEVCFQVLEELWLKVWHLVLVLKSLTQLSDQFSEEVVAIKNSLLLLNKWLLNKWRLNHHNNIILVICHKINSCNVWKIVAMMSAFAKVTWMLSSNVRLNLKETCNSNDQFTSNFKFNTNDI